MRLKKYREEVRKNFWEKKRRRMGKFDIKKFWEWLIDNLKELFLPLRASFSLNSSQWKFSRDFYSFSISIWIISTRVNFFLSINRLILNFSVSVAVSNKFSRFSGINWHLTCSAELFTFICSSISPIECFLAFWWIKIQFIINKNKTIIGNDFNTKFKFRIQTR